MSDKQRGPETIDLARPYGRLTAGLLLFAGSALFFAHEASTNDRGLVINGIIHLDPGGADVFYVVFAMLSAAFVGAAILGIRALHARPTLRIVIGKKKVTLPPTIRFWEPASREDVEIRYEDLVSISVSSAAIRILRRDGVAIHLAKMYLPDGLTLRDVADRIMARARARADVIAEKAADDAAK